VAEGSGGLTLVLGPEELLTARAVAEVLAATRARDPAVDVRDLSAATVDEGLLIDLASPSMFGELRLIVLRGAQDLAEGVRDALVDALATLPEDVVLVVTHSGVSKGKRLVDALQAAGAQVVRCAAVAKPGERQTFVIAEARTAGRSMPALAARTLVDAVGSDLRELAAAVAQLAADTPGTGPLDEGVVAQAHRGRAETSGFQIADAAMAGDGGAALSLLRQALATGTAEVLVVSAVAGAIREVALVEGTPGGVAALAKTLGMPPWKVEKAQRQARGWGQGALAQALQAAAAADERVKGAAADPAYALERLVLEVAGLQAAGRGRAVRRAG